MAQAGIEGREIGVARFEDEATDTEGIREGDPGPGQIGLSGLEYSLGCGNLQVSLET